MKNFKFLSLLSLVIAATLSGCLKDKDYEDQKYGIQISSQNGIGFGQAPSSPVSVALNIVGTTQTLTTDLTVESQDAASSDVAVTLIANSTAVVAAGLTPLPISNYAVSLSQVISKGTRLKTVSITIPTTLTLNPTLSYGIGLSIASVGSGYQIATNLKTVVLAINLKNQYDGKYTLKGRFYHPTLSPGDGLYTINIEMWTSGPNRVKIYMPQAGFQGFFHPILNGAAISAFASQEPEYTIDQTTNAVTVQNTATGAVTFYAPLAGSTNRWIPATKVITAKFGYNLDAGNVFNAANTRQFTDTLTYLGPR